MSERHEILSDGWLAALERVAQGLLDAAPGGGKAAYVYAERFTDAPGGQVAGYILRLAGGKAQVTAGWTGSEEAACIVAIDHGVALDSMRYKTGPALSELSRKAAIAGKLFMSGSLEGAPIPMNALHDAMCDRTLLLD